MTMLAA